MFREYENKILILCIILFCVILFYTIYSYVFRNIDNDEKKIYKYFYLPKHEENNTYELPKTIYCYWDNYNDDEFIKMFINNWKSKLSPDWKIVVLHKDNVNEYTNGKMLKYKDLDSTKYSDFLRLLLLKEHGGVWIDISTILINGDFLDKYHNEMIANKNDCLLYEFKNRTVQQKYPYFESWFIMAPKNSKLINDWFYTLDKSFEIGFQKFKKEILIDSGMDLSNTIGYNEDIYLLIHACINFLLYKDQQYNILIKDAGESNFKFQNEAEWDNEKLSKILCEPLNSEGIYSIKLTGSQRNYLRNKDCLKNIL